jgi:hypothetical protein
MAWWMPFLKQGFVRNSVAVDLFGSGKASWTPGSAGIVRCANFTDQIKSEPLVNIQLLAPLPDGPTYTDSEWFEVS